MRLALFLLPGLLAHSQSPDRARELHKQAFVFDAHVHVINRQFHDGSDIGQRLKGGQVDLPRLRDGGVDALFFSLYIPEEYYPHRFETKHALRLIDLAKRQIEANKSTIGIALNGAAIDQLRKQGRMAAVLDLEGGFDLDGDLHLLRALHRLGLRSLQLTAHNETNAFIDSCCSPGKWKGINEHGRAVIAEMNRLGMLINVAHASDEAILQTVAASRHPVAYTHGGFRGIVDNPRCLTDAAAKAIAAKGGVIGIQFGSTFNNPKYAAWIASTRAPSRAPRSDPKHASLSLAEVDRVVARGLPFVFKGAIPDEYWMGTDQLARVIDYGVRLVGEDHVALGSDFDGGPPLPRQIRDVSDYPEMTKALQQLGYPEQRIRKILGSNWLRLIRQVTEGR